MEIGKRDGEGFSRVLVSGFHGQKWVPGLGFSSDPSNFQLCLIF